eukprot:TRINITY_DN565_c0_g2_i1.p1 TRINITY_DN565_c0_g2~~TRINITY_DN565_c0_g2_i1.p1  ORF type:complete len:117 (-),score=16.89 TRINITY_DN565_c0_g2_i1:110-460(-)
MLINSKPRNSKIKITLLHKLARKEEEESVVKKKSKHAKSMNQLKEIQKDRRKEALSRIRVNGKSAENIKCIKKPKKRYYHKDKRANCSVGTSTYEDGKKSLLLNLILCEDGLTSKN